MPTALIERTDEAVVVYFIASFKSYQFLTGLYYCVSLAMSAFTCFEQTATGGTDCEGVAPGQEWYAPWAMLLELTRCVLLLASGAILAGGATYGGVEELLALEHVRIQVAGRKLSQSAERRVLAAARLRYGTKTKRGGVLPKMLLYDLVLVTVILTWLGLHVAKLRRTEAPTWLVWTSCYYAKVRLPVALPIVSTRS